MNKHLILGFVICTFLIALLPQSFALGIAPSTISVLEKGQTEETFDIKIVNSEGVAQEVILYSEGDLAEYITLSTTKLEFAEGETEKKLSGTFTLPQDNKQEGTREGKIIARQIVTKKGSSTAQVAVAATLRFIKPYSGAHLQAKLYVPNIETDVESNFIIEVENLGSETAYATKAILDIEGPFQEHIKTITSEEKNIPAKEKEYFTILWNPDVSPGEYVAKATILYDDANAADTKSFTVGTPTINIKQIVVNNFRLGSIAKFDILVENVWNKRIPDLYGVAEIFKGNQKLTQSKTESVNIGPYELQELNAYWDTAGQLPDTYDLHMKLFFLDKVVEEQIPIVVTEDEISVGPIGQVTGAPESTENRLIKIMYIVVGLVVALILLNIYLFLRKKKQ